MENEILLQIVERFDRIDTRLDKIDTRLDKMDAKIDNVEQSLSAKIDSVEQSLQTQINDMRGSQMVFEHRMTDQMGAIMDSHAVMMDIARDTQKILHMLQASQEKYDSDKVAVDVTIIDHERRIVHLERQAV